MLWYKAWRESRIRFLLSAAVLVFLSVGLMYRARTGFPPSERPDLPYSAWVWANIYGNLNPTVFIILTMILGLGGLQRERPVGTSAFTLTLPVTRFYLVAVRAVTGLVQVLILSLIPALLIPTLSPIIARQSYPETQALQFALLFVSWGAVAFGIGFLWSSLFSGEFTGTALCVITPVVYKIFAENNSTLQRYPATNYANFMSGFRMPYVHSPVKVLIDGPLPWGNLLILALVTLAFIACAARVTCYQDF
jgi:ABC-type transport system involved in multi-copper enzyme maturation permease subunit